MHVEHKFSSCHKIHYYYCHLVEAGHCISKIFALLLYLFVGMSQFRFFFFVFYLYCEMLKSEFGNKQGQPLLGNGHAIITLQLVIVAAEATQQ
jgi:hypothetical protein